jgi:hypothetical protein
MPEQDFNTTLVAGAIDRPKDYELIYDNKYFVTNNSIEDSGQKISIWRPIPNDGFSAVGVVFNRGYKKPLLDEVCCVSNDYLKEIQLESNPYWYHLKSNLLFWKNTSNNYMNVFNVITRPSTSNMPDKPNQIDNLIFDIITDERDFSDRLYLDKNKYSDNDDLLTTVFRTVNKKKPNDTSSAGVYDYLMDIENNESKIMSYTTDGNGNMCMALPQPYWASFYDMVKPSDRSNGKEENINVGLEQCKGQKYIGTNWNIYEDNSIRLKDEGNYCLTYNTDKNRPVLGVNNNENYLSLNKCNDDLKNQKFLTDDSKIRLFDEKAQTNNYCLYHSHNNDLKVVECDTPQYSVLWKWGTKIRRHDMCSKKELEKYMEENVTHIQTCTKSNHYVVYREEQEDDKLVFKNHPFCFYNEAKDKYEDIKDKYTIVGLVLDGKILKSSISTDYRVNIIKLQKYTRSLMSKANYCDNCSYPNRLICSDNRYIKTKNEYFEDESSKDELINYCYNMKPNSTMKCDKQKRQKFVTNKLDKSFCLGESKEVFIYITNDTHHYQNSEQSIPLNINLSRGPIDSNYDDKLPIKIDNLLAEGIDPDNYHIFVKGIMSIHNDKEYRIIFDPKRTGINNPLKPIIIPKTSYDIILNNVPKYEDINIGTKVLCRLEIGEENNDSIAFKNKTSDGKTGEIYGTHIKWLAVVTKKLKDKYFKIMFSINSYEYDPRRETSGKGINRPFQSYNFEKIVHFSELILLKKAPICI